MAKTKINAPRTDRMPNAFHVATMRGTDERMAEVETEQAAWVAVRTEFHTTFRALDDAFQQSMASLQTKTVADKDSERDVYGQVIEQVSKQWSRLPDETLAIHGRRVYQVFRDIDYRASEALVAQNEKVINMEQRFAEAQLQADLTAMGLTAVNQPFAALTQEIITLMSQRQTESASRVQGELKAAREQMDEVFARFVELTNALIVVGNEPALEQLAAYLNADYKKIEEQMAQSKKLPTVLVKSEVVGNHRYSVPEFAKWSDIVAANEKSFAIDPSTDYIVSLAAKAKKVGGLFLALNGTAVRPTDSVDAKKEYELLAISGESSGGEVTPVRPE